MATGDYPMLSHHQDSGRLGSRRCRSDPPPHPCSDSPSGALPEHSANCLHPTPGCPSEHAAVLQSGLRASAMVSAPFPCRRCPAQVSPQSRAVSVPFRATYSHSASLMSRFSSPVFLQQAIHVGARVIPVDGDRGPNPHGLESTHRLRVSGRRHPARPTSLHDSDGERNCNRHVPLGSLDNDEPLPLLDLDLQLVDHRSPDRRPS